MKIHIVSGMDYDDYMLVSAFLSESEAEAEAGRLQDEQTAAIARGDRGVGRYAYGVTALDVVVPPAVKAVDVDPVWAMLNRMYDGDVPTVAPDRTMWHYTKVVQDWTIRLADAKAGWDTYTFQGTREQAETRVRNHEGDGHRAQIVEEW